MASHMVLDDLSATPASPPESQTEDLMDVDIAQKDQGAYDSYDLENPPPGESSDEDDVPEVLGGEVPNPRTAPGCIELLVEELKRQCRKKSASPLNKYRPRSPMS
jgi:hypothetical protein